MKPKNIYIIASTFYKDLTNELLQGVRFEAVKPQYELHDETIITIIKVPGAFEIPGMVKQVLDSRNPDLVITIGVLIKGETNHFEYISESVAHSLSKLTISSSIPIIFGVITALNYEQASERALVSKKNKGAEVDLSFIWVQAQQPGALEWTSNLNWSTNEAKVVDLGADTDYITYAGGSGYYNVAAPGYSLGTIVGSAINRDASGNYKVLSNGFYDIKYGTDPEENTIGDATPNFLLNFGNRITYKNFALNFLISHVNGGDIMSMTTSVLLGRGLVEDTVDREQSFILPGVNPSGQPNTTQIVNSDFYFYNVLYGPGENRIYDGSVIRLQEVSLTYNLPKSILDSTPFGSLSLSASGFNLWYDAYNTPDSVNFDPNVAGVGIGNGRGFDWLNGPSSKRYGLSLKATF